MKKHFQSHWKELLATDAAQKKPAKQAADSGSAVPSDTTTDAVAEGESESRVATQAEAGSEHGLQLPAWWHRARDLLHRYRYPALAVSVPMLAVCLVVVYGRDDGRADRVRVSGQVFLDDKPLTTGRIVFVPEKGGRPSIGNIDERGHFTLTCFDGNDGAVVGKYRIEIVPSKAGGEDGPPSPIPVRYNSQETSGLTADIRGPTGNLKFTIVSERTPTPRDTGPDPRKLRPERQ